MKLLRTALNGWLFALALDGAIRVLAGLVDLATGSQAVALILLPVELVVVVGGLAVWVVAAAVGQIPKRVVLPPLVVICWMMAGALPFSVLFYNSPGFQLSIGLVLLLTAAATEALARTAGHGRWFLKDEVLGETVDFRWKRALGWVAGWALIGPVVLVSYLVLGSAWAVSWGSAGFLRLTPTGIAVAHKIYVNGPDTADLIAMIHLGEDDAYPKIFAQIPQEGTLVLAEGVSDSQGLITAPGDAYAQAAGVIGLSVQKPIGEIAALEVRNADVDVSTFDPVSLELLNAALGMYGSKGNLEGALTDYLMFWSKHQRDARQVTDQLFEDILHSRNRHLLNELETARTEVDRIVLPWGALHMVGIEQELKDRGWTHTETHRVVLIRWSTVLGRD